MSETPHQTDIIIGNNLVRIRKARGMSLEALASRVGVTFQQIQKYSNGKNRISASMADLICQALSCSINDLFAGTAAAGCAPLSLPSVSAKAMQVAELFEKIESEEAKAAIVRLLKAVSSHRAAEEEAA